MLFCVERIERNTRKRKREREGVYCKICVIVSFGFCVIKRCVLSPLSVSKPPLVVPPTNKSYTVSIAFLKFTTITHAKVVLGFAFLSFFNINLQDNTKRAPKAHQSSDTLQDTQHRNKAKKNRELRT